MGMKGDKMKSASVEVTTSLLEKLSNIENISSKKMFGGHGIFHDNKMFGMVDSKGEIFLKANDELKIEYLNIGAIQHTRMPYFSLPQNILDNDQKLENWANKSIKQSK